MADAAPHGPLRTTFASFSETLIRLKGVVVATSSTALRKQPEPPAPPMPAHNRALNILIVLPTLDFGAADAGAVEIARILRAAGHRPIVVSTGGRLAAEIEACGGTFLMADVATKNPVRLLRNAMMLRRLARDHQCDLIHALGRAPAWSALLAARSLRMPFVTSWYKGFREQNQLKHLYNSVMVRGDRVVAVGDQLAELIHDRYGTPWERIVVVPVSVDGRTFDPASVSPQRVAEMRRFWGAERDTRLVLVPGRMARRKGHHVAVEAARRLKDSGFKDFAVVIAADDAHRTRYAGELWDLVLATGTTDVIRLVDPIGDRAAAYAAADVVVSAAIQPEGVQRALLEAQAMQRPVIASELGAGADVVLAPPAVAADRMTGLRIAAGDDAALAAALVRLFALTPAERQAIGARGRAHVLEHFASVRTEAPLLNLYGSLTAGKSSLFPET